MQTTRKVASIDATETSGRALEGEGSDPRPRKALGGATRSGQQSPDNVAVHVSQAVVAALVAERQALVIEPEEVE